MRNIKLTLEYDGTHFFGFQTQKKFRTVQSELEQALRKLFGKKIKVVASGRTDSGVHAEGQVVNFSVESDLALFKIERGLNRYLAEDLAVKAAEEVPLSFHSQYSAKWKAYEYRILHSKNRSPLERSRAFYIPYPLNVRKMKKAADLIRGKHDFRVFEGSGSRRKTSVRHIRVLNVRNTGNQIRVRLEANGFLYKMVRSIVGTLVEIGSGRLKVEEVRKMISECDKKLVGATVPPQGLVLKEVKY